MDPDIEDRIADWPSRTVSGGYEGLWELADADFSGAASFDHTWVFMVGGQVVGLRDGSIEDIEGATGTAYQAPADALPLLFTMQTAADTEIRGQYYTEETPLSEVDATLQDAGFTGYLELSENVLSGDYYVVYHGGRSRSVAIVGTREEVRSGQEAYELAADEVGIYDVVEAPVTVTDIPQTQAHDGPSGGIVGTDSAESPEQSAPTSDSDIASERSESRPDATTTTGSQPEVDGPGEDSVETHSGTGDHEEGGREDPRPSGQGDRDRIGSEATDDPEGEVDSGPEAGDTPDEQEGQNRSSLGQSSEEDAARDSETPESAASDSRREENSDGTTPDPAEDDEERTLEERVETAEAELERARKHGESVSAERTELAREVETLKNELSEVEAERDELIERVTELEAQLPEDGDPTAADRIDRPFTEAMQETHLFVRYQTRADPTLEDIRQDVDREHLRDNLAIEVHTAFDSATVSIEGVPFETALRSSPHWAFLNWLVADLPFEIRDTGQTEGLRGLVDTIPDIDRIDLLGGVQTADGNQDVDNEVGFDVICRDKTGVPLVVADIHQGREPVGGESIEDLVTRAGQVVDANDALAAAFAVSPSFYSPDALEAAQTATSSGFLSRDSRLSYVKPDRSRGYHLCLVEARGDAFHVTVPEL